ncbi:MAG: L-seryl-tRNA(Sec) selenium transferase [candidate division Zixibacteria bacterium]|nr:L-seryl-tRNA(Sec) selenium transferase [candidate division Zixibacteria bacterium]
MAEELIKTRRDFPAVETLLRASELKSALGSLPRPVAVAVVREVVAALKKGLDTNKGISKKKLFAEITSRLRLETAKGNTRVINATGVVVHTNLGRSPFSETLLKDIQTSLVGYGNVEFDLTNGRRGGRGAACEDYLTQLTGTEAGTVVNNNAAALFLILNTLANRKKVLISRGELVQIGGGFRIPDILRRAGARLSEVGTTNVTSLADYENAIDDRTGLILKVHKSNFIQAGFTDEVDLKPLVALGRKHSIPVVNDLGSGVLLPTGRILGYREPTVQESVRVGADLTCFSGDKLLGGMQSGLIVGRRDLITRIKKNPLFRTVRVDKVVFFVLERLLTTYLNGTHQEQIKLWQMLGRSIKELEQMATAALREAGSPDGVTVEKTKAQVGGGALPEQDLASVGLVFDKTHSARQLMKKLRQGHPPVIGRIDDDRLILDLKAVDPSEVSMFAQAIKKVLKR